MAVPARTGASDARVPCPLCGGLIHPIAGRCKHCKADLTAYRAARPAASAPLPALQRAPADSRHASGPAASAASAVPAGTAAGHAVIAHAGSHPVLPPRPQDSYPAPTPVTSTWRSWPVLVILVATAAILVAVVLMVWPAQRADPAGPAGKRARTPPPAPERMDTQSQPVAPKLVPKLAPPSPAPPQAAPQPDITPDPWSGNQVTPPDPGPEDYNPPAPEDPERALGGPQVLPDARSAVMFAMAERLCRKMVQCGNHDTMMKSLCDSITHSGVAPPSHCPAADRCLRHIDAMSCGSQDADLTQLSALFAQFTDCADAIRC